MGPMARRTVSVSILAKVESGFTRGLAASSHNEIRILIDGPYGNSIDTGPYDRITMMATGAGIAAQLSYVKGLLSTARSNNETCQQWISLIWQLEEECGYLR